MFTSVRGLFNLSNHVIKGCIHYESTSHLSFMLSFIALVTMLFLSSVIGSHLLEHCLVLKLSFFLFEQLTSENADLEKEIIEMQETQQELVAEVCTSTFYMSVVVHRVS